MNLEILMKISVSFYYLRGEIMELEVEEEDYILITDMIKYIDGNFFVTDCLINRNTIEF